MWKRYGIVRTVWTGLGMIAWAGISNNVKDMGFKLVCCPWPSELWLKMGKVYLLLVRAGDGLLYMGIII